MAKTKGKIASVDASKGHVTRIVVKEEDKDGKHIHTYVLNVPPSWNKHQILEELKKQSSVERGKRMKSDSIIGAITPEEIEEALNG